MKLLFVSVLFFIVGAMSAQTTLVGTITNADGTEPVVKASVYVSGSSNGTRTNSQGRFKLTEVNTPCQLVISHLGYELKVINLKDDGITELTIRLTDKERKLNEVLVSSKSRRAANVYSFRRDFLGKDEWGRKAILLNDSDLIFSRQTDTLSVKTSYKVLKYESDENDQIPNVDTSKIKVIETRSTLTVTAKGPLIVDLPLLGYRVSVDLVDFVSVQEGLSSYNSFLGYYLFQPYQAPTIAKQEEYERNRRKAYYCSPMHFVHSLYTNTLKENGYIVFRNQFMVPDSVVKHLSSEESLVHGQKGKEYLIYYVAGENNKPADLSNKRNIVFESVESFIAKNRIFISNDAESKITFLADTCMIRRNGTTPGNTILFKGKIGDKKVGALLPDDYNPETKLQIPTPNKK